VKIVVGLGNPGIRYHGTRHNIGFLVIDSLAQRLNIALDRHQCDALTGLAKQNDEPLLLAKPQTFMNHSGAAVAGLLQQYGVVPNDLVVIYDDLDLPLGRIRVRPNGSAGGHRGVSSIIEHLASTGFCRLRIGIGRPPVGVTVIDHVLAPFAETEAGEVSKVVERAREALECLIHQGVEAAMGVYNRAD